MIHDIVEANGKTIKENNLAKQHKIPIGTLVEISGGRWDKCRLYVTRHTRDCDGEPLYSIGPQEVQREWEEQHGYGEDGLTAIPEG